jgi:hypothetical protein
MRTIKFVLTSAFLGSAIAATTIVAGAQTPPPQTPKPADVTVTGCVIRGSDPTVFVLDNARMDPKSTQEVAKKYVLVSGAEDMPLKDLIDHEVTATGVVMAHANMKATLPPTAEKDLPVLTARTIATVADRCMAHAGR